MCNFQLKYMSHLSFLDRMKQLTNLTSNKDVCYFIFNVCARSNSLIKQQYILYQKYTDFFFEQNDGKIYKKQSVKKHLSSK